MVEECDSVPERAATVAFSLMRSIEPRGALGSRVWWEVRDLLKFSVVLVMFSLACSQSSRMSILCLVSVFAAAAAVALSAVAFIGIMGAIGTGSTGEEGLEMVSSSSEVAKIVFLKYRIVDPLRSILLLSQALLVEYFP